MKKQNKTKIDFELPDRKYCDGPKSQVTMRLPKRLMDEIGRIATDGGWSTTDLVSTALDQFVRWSVEK